MELHQVNSVVLHQDPIRDEDIIRNGEGTGPNGQGRGLEKKTTAVSSTSYDEWYPEGGLRAWLVVVGSWFALISSLGLMNSIAVFQAYTLSHQLKGHSEGTVGWIFSLYTFLSFFGGVYIGPVFDKYGPRWLVIAGCIITVAGVVCMSFCKGTLIFYLSLLYRMLALPCNEHWL